MKMPALLFASTAALFCGCSAPEKNPLPAVRVTLDDGQVLVGALSTRRIQLDTGVGPLSFDSSDAGELGLLEGENVKQSEQMIRLWLRNGSEFVGRWEKPAVEVTLSVGGEDSSITVPIDKLKRLQFQGAAVWPQQAVFRIQTRAGDDFFVDVSRTRMAFTSEFGRFRPFLSELAKLQPLDEENKRWRILLSNGTVINAELEQEKLDLQLAMGPSRLALPVAAITRMDRQNILAYRGQAQSVITQHSLPGGGFTGFEHDDAADLAPGASFGRFYSNQAQKAAKSEAAKSWTKAPKE